MSWTKGIAIVVPLLIVLVGAMYYGVLTEPDQAPDKEQEESASIWG